MNTLTQTFAKMSDIKPTTASERSMLEYLQTTFPHAVVRHSAVSRGFACAHHFVSVETAEFFCAGSGELLSDALADVFGTLGDLENAGSIGAYAA